MKSTEWTNRDEGKEYVVRCVKCQNETRHHVIWSHIKEIEESNWFDIYMHQVIQCRGCSSLTFRYQYTNPDSEQEDAETGESFDASEIALYPSRGTKTELRHACHLPHGIQMIYRELLAALGSRMPVLAAIGMGSLIEAVCKDLGESGNLNSMIDALVSKGKIRSEEAEILHDLRKARNASAHEIRIFRDQELLDAVNLIEHILVSVYLLPHARGTLPSDGTTR